MNSFISLHFIQIFDWCMDQIIAKKVSLDETHTRKINRALHNLMNDNVEQEEDTFKRTHHLHHKLTPAQLEVVERYGEGVMDDQSCGVLKRATKVDKETGREIRF
jgi:hypothetical protein